jgi:hypothetical protein
MVKTYVVLEPASGLRDAESADAVRFVREKFYWTALLFTPIWLARHRLWLALVVWFVTICVIGVAAFLLDLDPTSFSVALMLPALVVAFDGAELRRRKLVRAGYRDAGVAVGEDVEDAERRFFAEWSAREPKGDFSPPMRPPAATAFGPSVTKSVVGLFPQPGGGR